MSNYNISEEDVDAVVRYMQIYHPEKANAEYCRQMLEYLKSSFAQIAHDNPDDIEALYEVYEANIKSSR